MSEKRDLNLAIARIEKSNEAMEMATECINALLAERDAMAAKIAALEAERDALRADAERLEFVMRNIAGASLRRIAGELADTGSLDAFRAAIDSRKANKEGA